MKQAASLKVDHRQSALGHGLVASPHWNLAPGALYEHAIRRCEAELAAHGALVARTGAHTGRSPNDKFIVRDRQTEDGVSWGTVNRPFEAARFQAIKTRLFDYLAGRELYVLDCFAGADSMNGGAGNDSYGMDNALDVIVEGVNGGTDTLFAIISVNALAANVENIVLQGTGNLDARGNALANRIDGTTGANTLRGEIGRAHV